MTKLAPEWVRTSDPVIRSPARYRWTTAPAYYTLGKYMITYIVNYWNIINKENCGTGKAFAVLLPAPGNPCYTIIIPAPVMQLLYRHLLYNYYTGTCYTIIIPVPVIQLLYRHLLYNYLEHFYFAYGLNNPSYCTCT